MTPPLDPDHCGFGYVEPLPPSEGQTGFLSPTDTRWGKPTCPWRIEGRPGQYVNLTLHDYSYFGVPNTQQPAFCRQYLTVSDGPGSKPKTIMSCSHELRHRTIYISRTNELSLYFLIDQKENPNIQFLLEFQGNIIVCEICIRVDHVEVILSCVEKILCKLILILTSKFQLIYSECDHVNI